MPLKENRRLLIVDDEPEIRAGYRAFLSPDAAPVFHSSRIEPPVSTIELPRFDIVESESGEQALRIFLEDFKQGKRFAGAIVDVRMPGKLDGLQFIREAWKSDPNLLVVIATAYQDRSVDEINKFFSSEFQDQWDYLTKPFTAGEIVQKARQLVSSWNRRERERQYLQQIRDQRMALIDQERLAAIGNLARSVGHEFGNVLQPLITKLEVIKHKLATGNFEGLEPLVDEMTEATLLGASICQDLLTFSREPVKTPKEDRLKKLIEPSPISLGETIDKSLRLLRHEMKRKDIQLELVRIPEAKVRFPEPQLIQVFVNVMTNALDAVKDGGKIDIRMETPPAGDFVRLEVKDNGGGIGPENLNRVFEPLFTTKGDRGNGLGLAVCKRIMDENHGKISIESKLGEGTTLRLELPKG